MLTIILSFARNLTWKGWFTVAVVAGVLALLTTLAVNKVIDNLGDNAQVRSNNEDRELRDDLSKKRTKTETKINTDERLLNEELAKIPDAVPSDRRLLRACRELQNDGHVVLPASCGPYTN